MKKRIASIDIGTNSVLLTIAESPQAAGFCECPAVFEAATITRLGEGLAFSKKFGSKAIDRTITVLKKYTEICREKSVEKIYAVGTAAMRKAKNSAEFIKKAKKICGIDIEVISGVREAELSFKAVEADFGNEAMVIDIGGGSTELVWKNKKLNLESLPIGAVTLQETYGKSDPINKEDFEKMKNAIKLELSKIKNIGRKNRTSLVATAGTATTLAAMKLKLKKYSHFEVHGLPLELSDIKKIIDDLKARTIEERKKLPGLEPKRADVILAGTLILAIMMIKLGFTQVTVSDRGVRWGVLHEHFMKGS